MAGFDQFLDHWDRFVTALEPANLRPAMIRVGIAAKHDVTEAVRAELGDEYMSNWDRRDRRRIAAHFTDVGDDALIHLESNPRARAPMRTLERRAGVASSGVALVAARTGQRAAASVHEVVETNLGS